MKFWKKIYFSVFLLFLVFLNSGIFLVFYISYSHNLAEEKKRILGENEVIRRTLENDISAFGKEVPGEREFHSIMTEYEEMFQQNTLSFVLWQKDVQVFCSEGMQIEQIPQEGAITIERNNGIQTAYVVTAFEINGNSYRLALVRSLMGLTKLWDQLRIIFLLLSGILSVILAAALYVMMRRLNRPLNRLSQKTKEVAAGNYELIPVSGNDEIAELAQDFNLMTAAVKDKIQSQQWFVANLAHELRTPLTSISGYSEYLLRGNSDPDRQFQALQYINKESRRMQQMAQQLLRMARVQGEPIQLSEVSVNACLQEAYESCMPLAEEKELKILKEGEDFCMQGAEELLVCLFRNLLENAIRACGRGGEIRIHLEKEKLEICDNGIGMKEEELKNITEPFYRIDKARSRSDGGTGLGLALCREITELHRAKMQYESKVGEGTKVIIVFSSMAV